MEHPEPALDHCFSGFAPPFGPGKLLAADSRELSLADRMRRWVVVVPPVMLVYCLIVRGGVLDGWQGFYYAFQRTVAELMLSINLGRGFTRVNADVHSRY